MTTAAAGGTQALLALQLRLNHTFRLPELLLTALTHSGALQNNQRLEFLGDAVLGAVISAHYYRMAPDWSEGALSVARTAVVRKDSLARVAADLQLGSLLRTSREVARSGAVHAQPAVLADAVEALIGAVFLDGGYAAAEQVTLHLLRGQLTLNAATLPDKDAKTRLQEWLQARGRELPHYVVQSTRGPAHDLQFDVVCTLAKPALQALGQGASRKLAEQAAAQHLLQLLQQGTEP